MTNYQVTIKPSAQKEWDALNDTLFQRIKNHIISLANNPRPNGSRKLKNYNGFWRIRIGDYRVVYLIDDANKMVRITRIAHRSQVYD